MSSDTFANGIVADLLQKRPGVCNGEPRPSNFATDRSHRKRPSAGWCLVGAFVLLAYVDVATNHAEGSASALTFSHSGTI